MGNQNLSKKASYTPNLNYPKPNSIQKKQISTLSNFDSDKLSRNYQSKNSPNFIQSSDIGQSAQPTIVNYDGKFNGINGKSNNLKNLDLQDIVIESSNQSKENQHDSRSILNNRKNQNFELFSSNEKNSQKIQCQKGIIYQGCMISNMKQGFGKQIWPDGSVYIGQWKNNLPHGKGGIKHSNFDSFEGIWNQGKVQGYGVYRLNYGASYQGQWKNDKKNGKGIQKYLDKSVYQGEFLKGMRHGNGKLIFSNGSIYQGEFKRNQFHGYGKFIWPSTKTYQGYWKNGRFNGNGKLVWQNGNIYQGEYLNDQRNGIGTFYDKKSNKYYSGTWVMGRLQQNKILCEKNEIIIN